MVFQDPNSSLNPRMRVEDIVAEPLLVHTKLSQAERLKRAREILEVVGLSSRHARRYPHEFSGGQRQRIALARTLVRKPEILILDEATSSLDSDSETLIQNSIKELRGKTTLIVIAHRLSTVQHADKLYAINNGKIMESGSPNELLSDPNSYFSKAYNIK